MRGSNLLVTVQIRGMIKEEEKRNRSLPVLIFGGGGGGRGSQDVDVKRGGKERKKESRSTTEPGGVGEQRRGISYKKALFYL